MAGNIQAQTIIVKAKNVYLIQDKLVSIVEKFNHGSIETVGSNDKLIFNYWASPKENREISESLKNSNFDIQVEMVIIFREVEE